jgi:hypothetical protein
MRLAVVVITTTLVMTTLLQFAHAQCALSGISEDTPCEQPYHAWSWLPEVLAAFAYDETGTSHSLFGAEIRIRHQSPYHRPGRAYTLGLGVETYERETIEPYAALGIATHTEICATCDGELETFGAAHFALGGGMQWRDDRRHREPFALARVSLGIVFTARNGKHITQGMVREVAAPRLQLRSQIDLVLETTVARDGEYRITFGIAFDPLRLPLDIASRLF